MFSLFTRDEAFQVHNDPARVWVFLLPSVESFPFLSEARLRGLLRSAEVCGLSARCVGPVASGFWFLVFGPPLTQSTAQPPQSARFRVSLFRVSVFRGQTYLGTLHGTDRFVAPHPAFFRHRAGNGTGTDATNILRGQATQPVSCSSTRQGTRDTSRCSMQETQNQPRLAMS